MEFFIDTLLTGIWKIVKGQTYVVSHSFLHLSQILLSEAEHTWIIDQLYTAAQEAGPQSAVIKRIVLFGSVARRKAKVTSDADMVLVYEGLSGDIDNLFYDTMKGAIIPEGHELPLVTCEFHYVRMEVWKNPEQRDDIEPAYRQYVLNMKRGGIVLYE